ncbi:MAG: helix-turn-helix domain-containing protein [Phycisphaerales bacterium]|nr:helix-turn-helix domain-containing protein [Phycisphaerae bacterium]NNF42859.1 helix-turn-helix domain-containing protein [Phycisphaerales bacterium]NNM27086.1 helix-turn-helix domain-containing protein [Phycisphaerales bacterium]
MAKMFYTLEEVAEKLGKTEDEVREMAAGGQIQEFRDRDKLMFKVEQINLLAGDEDTADVHLELEDTSGGSGLGLTGTGTGEETGFGASGMPLSDSREGTGISVFDTDHGGDDEDGDRTRVGESLEEDLSLEAVGSGSGLLDLTRESDDTSLGAELLEEVYSGEENVEIPANASGLFEAAATDTHPEEAVAAASIAAMPMMVETYDGAGSGLGVGLMLGAIAGLVCTGMIVIVGFFGATSELALKISDNLWMWVGGLAGVTVVFGLIGLFIGKSSE